MPPIAIITDTDSSLPLELARKHNIVQVPITVQFGDKAFRDVYDIDNPVIFGRIDQTGKFPTTAAPSPGQFAEAFKSAFETGAGSVLCFNVSSEVSATYASARNAADTLPGRDIHVIDTRNLCMGQGFMVLAAAEAVAGGASAEEAIAVAEDTGQRARHVWFACHPEIPGDERTHWSPGSRAWRYHECQTHPDRQGWQTANARTRPHPVQVLEARAVEVAVEEDAGQPIERMAILHVNAMQAARQFEALIRAALPCPAEVVYADMNPGLSIHTGTGLVGVVFVTAK